MTVVQGSLFGDPTPAPVYPDAPGWKKRATSKAAAEGIAPKAGTIRDQVLAALKAKSGTPEQLAKRIGQPVMNVRPRLTELSKRGLARDSGERGIAMGGRLAIVWEAVR